MMADKKAETVVMTKGGPLTTDDFVGDTPAPDASDDAYTHVGEEGFSEISKKISSVLNRK